MWDFLIGFSAGVSIISVLYIALFSLVEIGRAKGCFTVMAYTLRHEHKEDDRILFQAVAKMPGACRLVTKQYANKAKAKRKLERALKRIGGEIKWTGGI